MSTSGTRFRGRLMPHRVPDNGEFDGYGVCGDKICIFELSSRTNKITLLDFTAVILGLVLKETGSGLYLHPTKACRFLHVAATPEAVARVVSSFLFGFINALKKHISCLVKIHITDALDGAPNFVKVWQEQLHWVELL